ncbi:hypothetical protein GCM10010123_16980 [Pilimelia anulata]|uniref:LTD domain-containing protein n=2 Tax=Pilimelia anulata TaxID=53371 RepID=A0A8J3B9Q4_9ACTN|nr:hypothetical protein GCM10010123_16980 [Pilimelia anulata]
MVRAVLALALGATGGAVAATAPAEAGGPAVMITKIYYDPPGTDTRTNAKINQEYIELWNRRVLPTNLYKWWFKDAHGHKYTFTGTFLVQPNRRVVVRTGKGTNTSTTRYWGMGNYVWNNTGTDTARLYNPNNQLIDTCAYTGGGVYKTC